MDSQTRLNNSSPSPESHTVCKYCRSTAVRKFGKYKETQLYFCNSCNRKFMPNDALFHMKTPAEQVSTALNLYYSGSSINAIREHLKEQCQHEPSSATVFEWVNKYTDAAISATKEYRPKVGDTWIADETYVRVDERKRGDSKVENPYVKSRKAKWIIFWDIIDAKTRFLLASHVTTTRGTQDAKVLMDKAAKVAGKAPKVVVTDKLAAYLDGIELAYGGDTKHKQGAPFDIENNTNLIERFHGTLKNRTKVMRALKNRKSGQKFLDGYLVYYNYLREHETLEKRPAEAARIDYPFKDWVGLTRMVGPQAQVLITPAKVSVMNQNEPKKTKTLRITPAMPKISPRMGALK